LPRDEEWLKTLKEGMEIDALKIDDQNSISGWSVARIKERISDFIMITFVHDSKKFDR
jgi:hypothetical protein